MSPEEVKEMASGEYKGEENSSYPFTKNHILVWNSERDTNTPIARAWARLFDKGIVIGPPVTDEIIAGDCTIQFFQYAYAHIMHDTSFTVFSDARGVVGTESTL